MRHEQRSREGYPMIEALDHIAIGTADAGAIAGYEALLGRKASGARLQLANMALEFAATLPAGTPAVAAPQLGLMFGVRELSVAAHRLGRRAVPSAPLQDGRVLLDKSATHGVAIGLVAHVARAAEPEMAHDILGLDHVVVRTRDPERAVALYGGRLGLDLRLDRTNPERGNRLLFFVCGDLVVEVSHDTAKGVRPGPDSIWGLAWRSVDVRRSHTRMSAAGIAVSEIRTGNRAGTEVFTVKSHTAHAPTLVIGGQGLVRR
jgi:catechol 2,3-dioxygenase-like lactoylglutathione lyase family enzyme